MENEEIYRDVIYVYEEPDFSENRANEYGLVEKMKSLVDTYTQERNKYFAELEYAKSNNQKGGFLKFFSGFKEAMSDAKINPAGEIQLDLGKAIVEFTSIKWLPNKYKYCLNRDESFEQFRNYYARFPFVNFNDEMHLQTLLEYYHTYINNLQNLFRNTISKLKEEVQNAHFISVQELTDLCNTEKISIINAPQIFSGQILIKHPFMPKTYMGIETSENALFHVKMQCLSRIMQCLGATRISGHAYVSENKKREIDTNEKISYSAVSVDGSFNKNQDEKYESDYILEDAFSGDFSESSYEEALKEAKRLGLNDDFDIRNLLDQRNPQKENKMTARKVKIELTRELNESLDIAFGLQASGFGVNGAYKEILETNRKVMFELEIEF